MSRRPSPWACIFIGTVAIGACNKDGTKVVAPDRPTILGDKCSIEDEQSAPLIVDWSTSERSRLEAAVLRGGVVAMAVSECDIEPLWQCESTARYAYASATSRRESEQITDRASLFARIPLSAVSLSADVDAGAELSVDKTTVGRFETDTRAIAQSDLSGQCEGATHFVSAVDVGAFEFSKSRSAKVSAEAKSATVGTGGEASTDRQMLSSDGDLARCADAAAGQTQPPDGCGAPIQVELTPLLPSLDVEAWRAVARETGKKVMRECSAHGEGTSELWVTIEPSGRMAPGIGQTPFTGKGTGDLSVCVLDAWGEPTVPEFSGAALMVRVPVFVYPDDQARYDSLIDDELADSNPRVPGPEIGERFGYPWAKYGLTPPGEQP